MPASIARASVCVGATFISVIVIIPLAGYELSVNFGSFDTEVFAHRKRESGDIATS